MERTKLTVTIRHDLFSQIDAMIDGEKIRNRSHATEYLITKGLGLHRVRKALILAGGKGTRLRPFTYEIPPPLIPIHDQPVLAHTLRHLAQYDIHDVIIALGYKGEKIKAAIGDGKKYDVHITYVSEPKALGTAGPIRLAKRYLTEPFFLIWGDVLSDIDLWQFAQFHKDTGGVATVALSSVADPSHLGTVTLRGNRILAFIEKPPPGKELTKLVNTGYAICNPDIIDYVPAGAAMIERDVYPQLARAQKLIGYYFTGQWFDLSTPASYHAALKSWQVH